MEILTAGYRYELSNFENPLAAGQTLQFIHKTKVSENSTELETVSDGTTNEEVINVIIDRLQFLQSQFPCKENAMAITHLQEAENWLNRRTLERTKRGVDGKQLA